MSNTDSDSSKPDTSVRDSRHIPSWLPIALAVGIGVVAGLGSFTFSYAEGLSYFSTDPKACVNCHIMQPQYDAWQKASHHDVAVCVDCHLPTTFVAKYIAKAENGWRHGKEFTAQTMHEPIFVKPEGMAILENNCVRCHEGLVHPLSEAARSEDDFVSCVKCHFTVGHGEHVGLGGPLREDEIGSDWKQP